MTDVRSTDPDATAHRRARFKLGWKAAVTGAQYSQTTLEQLTWQNLGWRIGAVLGETAEDLIDEYYELCVRQQAAQGSEPLD